MSALAAAICGVAVIICALAAQLRRYLEAETHGRRVLSGAARPTRRPEMQPLECVDFSKTRHTADVCWAVLQGLRAS